MLRITAISAGMAGVRYLLRAAGCAEHDHAQHSREVSSKGAEYLLGGEEIGEPDGVWAGRGLEMLGLDAGQKVTGKQMRAVYGRLEHWETGESLGSRPRQYASSEARLAAALAKEPNAGEERQAQIRREVKAAGRQAVGYYDLTFSPVKSVSVYRAALRAAGEDAKADAVTAAHDQAVREALAYLEANVTTTRVGRHTTVTMDDGTRRTVGEYASIKGLVMTLWGHSSSREGDPHLHTHAAVLNRVIAVDGGIYAVDAQQFKSLKGAADVIYERRVEELVVEATGARFGWRPDDKTREILGVDRVLCDESSGRFAAIQGPLDAMVQSYRDEHGHEPGRQAMDAMRRQVWAQTRTAKTMLSPEALAERYTLKHGEQHLIDQVRNVAEAAERVGAEGLGGGRLRFATEDELLVDAVRRTQELYATWDETALALEVNKLLGEVRWGATAPAEITRLVGRALSPDGPADVVALTGRERVRVPEALRDGHTAEGLPVYRGASSLRYATRDQLTAEKALVAETHLTAGPKLEAERVAEVRAGLTEAGLGGDQLNAVMGVLCSGKAADVLIGPAGTGKSTTVGQLDRVWRERFGAPVLGLATSQRATDVLEGEGLQALNTAMFLARYMPSETGGTAPQQLVPGTMIVVDEAGMADTDKLAKIARLVRQAGGKLLYTGDHEQLAAVGTGGLLRLMTHDARPYELARVRRFHAEWEREASLKFRVGDPDALAEYERRGRLRGGAKAEMVEAAVRGYLADVLDGKDSVLVVKTNADATDLSARVRDELVALGRVGADPVAVIRDKAVCGVGDMVQARLNDHHADAQNHRMVVNRELFTVLGKDNRGYLEVQRHTDGTKVWLAPGYVAEHVVLAYAGTVHSVQGRTTDTSHSLVERGMSRNSAYVEATRGREANYLYAVTERRADEHDLKAYSVSAADVLGDVLANDGAQVSATETYRAMLEAGDSLQQVGAVWALAARDAMSHRHHDILLDLLGPDRTQWITGEDGHQQLMATLQHAELSGHDVERLLGAAITSDERPLDTAESLSGVLRSRVERIVEAAGDRPVPARWTRRLASVAGTISEYAQDLGQVMDDRAAMMARAAVLAPPDWALVALGPIPAEHDLDARVTWTAKVAAIGTYREMYGVDDDQMGIGPAPSRDQDPVRHVTWHRAWEALGRPQEQADHDTLTVEQLREQVDRWEREQQWAPVYVARELEQALTLAEEYRRESVTRWAQADAELGVTTGEITDEVQQLIDRAERADRMATRFTEAAARYERLHDARDRWAEHTADLAERAQVATRELDRRGDDLRATQPGPEQTELLDERGRADTEYAQAMAAEHEARAIDGELLLLDQHPAPELVEEIVDAQVVGLVDEPTPTELGSQTSPKVDQAADRHIDDLDQAEADGSIGIEAIDEIIDAELVDEPTPTDLDPMIPVEVDVVDGEVVEEITWEQLDARDATTADADKAETSVEPHVRGDFGTAFRLDEQPEADAGYPAPVEAHPDQESLFDVDAAVEDRVTVGAVRTDVDLTMRDAELRAELADARIRGRELRREWDLERQAHADDERRRNEWQRADRDRQVQHDIEACREHGDRTTELHEPELRI